MDRRLRQVQREVPVKWPTNEATTLDERGPTLSRWKHSLPLDESKFRIASAARDTRLQTPLRARSQAAQGTPRQRAVWEYSTRRSGGQRRRAFSAGTPSVLPASSKNVTLATAQLVLVQQEKTCPKEEGALCDHLADANEVGPIVLSRGACPTTARSDAIRGTHRCRCRRPPQLRAVDRYRRVAGVHWRRRRPNGWLHNAPPARATMKAMMVRGCESCSQHPATWSPCPRPILRCARRDRVAVW